MNIRGYLQTSLLEWPGKIAAVVFVGGCNFRCPFCHNRDLVLSPEKLPKIFEKEIFENLKKRKNWVDGICLTGGEPTLQKDLTRFLSRCKRMGFLTMIETNGTKPEVLKKLFIEKLLDRLSMDIKTSLNSREYSRVAGVKIKIEAIKESIKLILSSGIDFEFRTTVVPTLLNKKTLVVLAKQLRNLINHTPALFLQQFVPQNCLDPQFEKLKPYSKKEMEEILTAVQEYLPRAKPRGV